MLKPLVRWLSPALLALALVAPVSAQVTGEEPPQPAEKAAPNPAPAYVGVFLSTLLILFIVCKPTRKL
jgi:hypothetical protein